MRRWSGCAFLDLVRERPQQSEPDSSYFDVEDVTTDLATFGLVTRPWEGKRFGPSGVVFGYYDIEHYDPDAWQPGYDNPAMLRRTERDAAWMARIIARIGNAHLTAIVDEARFGDAFLEREALRLLRGRQRKLLARFLSRLSPLTRPSVRILSERGAWLCLDDAAVIAGVADWRAHRYTSRAWDTAAPEARVLVIDAAAGSVCAKLPSLWGANRARPHYLIVDLVVRSGQEPLPPARVHLYALGDADYRIVALERPDEDPGPP